ncbi:unnamed protein product [Discosporangium mesarthrocarpum]
MLVFESPLQDYTICATNVLYLGEYYRILTSALLHGNFMHLVFNMTSTLAIGSGLEMTLGTLSLAFIIVWSIVLTGLVHVSAEWAMTFWITGDPQYVHQHSVGFSGVIFTLALMESHITTQAMRSVFGMFEVPTRTYPWVLMLLISILMPNVSFMGHLSGILVGVMHVYGLTSSVMPSKAYCTEMEGYWIIKEIARQPNFVACPQPPEGQVEREVTPWNLLIGIRGVLVGGGTVVCWVMSTILHVLGLYSPIQRQEDHGSMDETSDTESGRAYELT